ncbi:hydrogenase maturation peptidase HycI [Methanobacterium aggregans]|uniref:hydrogenase maturation peptidase HycI n=1 Tax=Methanobacterium aggregans TaxID=1615586 RepID=UPI00315B320B
MLKLQLKEYLKNFLKNREKIFILGIGNDMKGDDAVGPVLADKLFSNFQHQEDIVVVNGGNVPENYTGTIRRENPSHIIFIDAVEMEKEPGYVKLVKKEEIPNYSISTHAMPISFLIKYLESAVDSKMILIGIQPKSMELGQGISKEVEKSVETIFYELKLLLEN